MLREVSDCLNQTTTFVSMLIGYAGSSKCFTAFHPDALLSCFLNYTRPCLLILLDTSLYHSSQSTCFQPQSRLHLSKSLELRSLLRTWNWLGSTSCSVSRTRRTKHCLVLSLTLSARNIPRKLPCSIIELAKLK